MWSLMESRFSRQQATSGADWAVSGLPYTSSGNFPTGFPLAVNQGTYQLLDHFYWGNGVGSPETLTASGLTPGQSYDARLYYRAFGNTPTTAQRTSSLIRARGRQQRSTA